MAMKTKAIIANMIHVFCSSQWPMLAKKASACLIISGENGLSPAPLPLLLLRELELPPLLLPQLARMPNIHKTLCFQVIFAARVKTSTKSKFMTGSLVHDLLNHT